jgi:hypothetical protein
LPLDEVFNIGVGEHPARALCAATDDDVSK